METNTLTENGVSTTKGLGEEMYIKCCLGAYRGKIYYQYDYRHLNGELFSTLRPTLGQCRKERDEWLKKSTVAFSGHRTNRIAKFTTDRQRFFINVAHNTWAAIEEFCIKKGYHTFLSGMADGFDIIAAEEVLRLKKEYPYIRLKCVIPFKGQADRYTEADRQRYNNILAQADEVITLSETYFEGCFLRRNDYLLENSAFLMVYYDAIATVGGTFYTLKRAVEKKMKFANVCYNRK